MADPAALIIKASVFSSCAVLSPAPNVKLIQLVCMYMFYFRFFFFSLSRFLYSRVIRFDGLPGRALRRDSRVLGERKTRCLEVLCCSLPYTLRQFRRKVSSPVHYLWGRSAFDDDSNRFSIHIRTTTCHPWLCVAAGGRWPSITVINVDGALDCVLCRPSVSSMSTLRWTLKILWPKKKNPFSLPFSIVTE